MNKFTKIFIFSFLACFAFSVQAKTYKSADILYAKNITRKVLDSKTNKTVDDKRKLILYKTENVVPLKYKLYKGNLYRENLAKRTYNSITYVKDNKEIQEIYAGFPLYRKDNIWYEVKTVLENPDVSISDIDLISYLLPRSVNAADVLYSQSGDGLAYKPYSSWSGAHDASSADYVDYVSPNYLFCDTGFEGGTYRISRCFVNFDTTGVNLDTIETATVSLYVQLKYDNFSDNYEYWSLVKATNLNYDTLNVDDFSRVENTLFTEKIPTSDIVQNSRNDFALNSAGIATISESGYTKFALRDGHDIENSAVPNNHNGYYNLLYIYNSEANDFDYVPRLTIVHSEVTPPAGSANIVNLKNKDFYNTAVTSATNFSSPILNILKIFFSICVGILASLLVFNFFRKIGTSYMNTRRQIRREHDHFLRSKKRTLMWNTYAKEFYNRANKILPNFSMKYPRVYGQLFLKYFDDNFRPDTLFQQISKYVKKRFKT